MLIRYKYRMGKSQTATYDPNAAALNNASIQAGTHERYQIPYYIGELWTARQRQMHPIHYTISYRASFKPELPDFFIQRFLGERKAATVLDPFGGRGTTILQSNLSGHRGIHNDRNPVSVFLARSRQHIPSLSRLIDFVNQLDLESTEIKIPAKDRARLSPFFHPRTLRQIISLREQFLNRKAENEAEWNYTMLTALSRLHGHSDGFFSIYSFPQISILPSAQERNNRIRGQKPEFRDIKERIIKKMTLDLGRGIPADYNRVARRNRYISCDSRDLAGVRRNSVDLVITSPPFLNKVNYYQDNWMRAWFLGMEDSIQAEDLVMTPDISEWCAFMADTIRELGRVLRPGGIAVIEVGEVKAGKAIVNLEELMMENMPGALPGGGRVRPRAVFINAQQFTKLANCWDVTNNQKGTNTNRCLIIEKT